MAEPIAGVGYLAGQCQFDGIDWVKSNLLWGYNDRYKERVYDGDLAVNEDRVFTAAVDPGYVYVLKSAAGNIVSATASNLWLGVYDGAYEYFFLTVSPPVSGWWYAAAVDIPLKEGDKVVMYLAGTTAGDDGDLRVWGYKMKIGM